MAEISIVVPIYNAEATIEACAASILGQTYTDIELILIDDGSVDRSGEIIDRIAMADKRVVVAHQTNHGQSHARGKGVALSSGNWITFVDNDDTLPPGALEKLIARADEDVDIVFGNGYTITRRDVGLINLEDFRQLAVRAEGTVGLPWGSLYRRDLLSPDVFKLPREIINGEDYIFWLRIIFKTEKPVAIVYNKVYCKGKDTLSRKFVWTSDYAQRINELRMASIPQNLLPYYAREILGDRLVNLYAVACCEDKSIWRKSKFYKEIRQDLKAMNVSLPIKSLVFLGLPSRFLRRWYSHISTLLHKWRGDSQS